MLVRLVLASLMAVAFGQTPGTPTSLGSVRGKIVHEATGEPLRKAVVMIQTLTADGRRVLYSALTNAAGEYSAEGIEPGSYNISASLNGFLSATLGATRAQPRGAPVTVAAAQRVAVDFKLRPYGVITGRVTSPEGEPMPNIVVTPMQFRSIAGRRQLFPTGSQLTNDLGEYRLSALAPGKYYVGATYRDVSVAQQTGIYRIGNQEEAYVPVYYPGTTTSANAVQVEVTSGRTAQSIDMVVGKVPTTRVGGRVINQTGAAGASISVSLNPADNFSALTPVTATASPQGNYELRGVPPGRYKLIAEMRVGQQQNFRNSVIVDVGKDAVDNADITLVPGYRIAGKIRLEPGSTAALKGINVGLRPSGPITAAMTPLPDGQADEEGNLLLSHANPDVFTVQVTPMPAGHYIKSARMGEMDMLEAGIDLTKGLPGPLDIVLSPKAGSISGVVRDGAGTAMGNATVVLIPENVKRRENAQWYRTLNSDASGKYTMEGLTPGDYKLYAWAEVETLAWMDQDFMRPIESRGARVTVRESGAETLELTVLSQ